MRVSGNSSLVLAEVFLPFRASKAEWTGPMGLPSGADQQT